MNWSDVGSWIKENAGTGVSLVGSLLTGNAPAAIAAGVSLVSSATGTDDPAKALSALQQDPQTLVRLKELYYQNEANVRSHIEVMARLSLEDKQAEHKTTQETIRNGDNSDDPVVRRTRPLQSWLSLFFAMALAWDGRDEMTDMRLYLVGSFLTLPWAYAGLRQVGKLGTSIADAVKQRKAAK